MVNKHKEFAESMRNIMRNDEKNRKENNQRRDDNLDEDSRSLQEILEQKFDELFGPIDDEEEFNSFRWKVIKYSAVITITLLNYIGFGTNKK